MIALAAALFLLPHATSPTDPAPTTLPDAPSASLSMQPSTQAPSATTPANPHDPAPQWRNIESLQPGDPIAVLETGHQYPTPCRFDDATDDSFTCIAYAPYSVSRRIIYPFHSITAVYTEEQTFEPPASHVLIAAGIGATLGGLLCRNTSPGAIVLGTVIGAATGALVVLSPPPTPFPRRPRIRLHLIYQAP
jgi:hypothetical protein